MDRPWTQLGLRAAGCAAVSGPLWWWLGPAVALPTAALWGIALAEPLYEVATDTVRRLRAHAWRDIDGVYYEHAGQPIEVLETDDARWLRAASLQRVLGDSAREAVFARRIGPDDARLAGRGGRWYLRDDAVLDYLERSARAMDSRRNALRLFVLREVHNPHRLRRRANGR